MNDNGPKLTNNIFSQQAGFSSPDNQQVGTSNPNMARAPLAPQIANATNQVKSNIQSGVSTKGGYAQPASPMKAANRGTTPTVGVRWVAPSGPAETTTPRSTVNFSPLIRRPEKFGLYVKMEDFERNPLNVLTKDFAYAVARYQGVDTTKEGWEDRVSVAVRRDDDGRYVVYDPSNNQVITTLRPRAFPGEGDLTYLAYETTPSYMSSPSDASNLEQRIQALLGIFGQQSEGPVAPEVDRDVLPGPGPAVVSPDYGNDGRQDVPTPAPVKQDPPAAGIESLVQNGVYKPGSIARIIPAFESPRQAQEFYWRTVGQILQSGLPTNVMGQIIRDLRGFISAPQIPTAGAEAPADTKPFVGPTRPLFNLNP